MRFSVITLFPELIEYIFSKGVVGQAHQAQLIQVECVNPRTFTEDVHKTVDDRPFGGGDGMIMLVEPLVQSLNSLISPQAKVIYMSPQGVPLTDQKVTELSSEKQLILICGRYGGIDQRFINEFVDEEISIGDYVLSGGELAAAVLIEAVSRKLPGVLGNQQSSEMDSFSNQRLEEPCFTRPRECLGQSVPEVLLSGNHKKIQDWRSKLRDLVTLKKRPDLLKMNSLQISSLKRFWSAMPDSEKKALGLDHFPTSSLADQTDP